MITNDELKNRFFYHSPTPDKARRHQAVNEILFDAARKLNEIVPPGRQLACMLTALEEAKMWGNAGIAQCAEVYESLLVEQPPAPQPSHGPQLGADSPRVKAFKAINSERDYQDKKWNTSTTPTGGKHTVTEFLVYVEYYLDHAKQLVTLLADPKASKDALHDVRKIAGLAVACMEQNGAPLREERDA